MKKRTLKRIAFTYPIFRPALAIIVGMPYAYRLFWRKAFSPIWSVLQNGETHNFTYSLTPRNLRYLAELVAFALEKSPEEIEQYLQEPIEDTDLQAHIADKMADRSQRSVKQSNDLPFGRRLGWYAIARAIKPRIIIETGVERGHESVLLCAALLRNSQEGYPGRYFGTDIETDAGWLLSGRYAEVGQILYGDSIESLERFEEPINLFINDSDHSADYEAREYETVREKLADDAIILGDNAHITDKLANFARRSGRSFLFFKEEPDRHWYPGAGIGIALSRKARD